MAIVATNIAYNGQGPVAGGSTIVAFGGSSNLELAYVGTAALVGDATSTTFVVNWIDGTNALPWTPIAVSAFRTGGNATNTISVLSANVINTTACSLNLSAAPGNNATALVSIMVFK